MTMKSVTLQRLIRVFFIEIVIWHNDQDKFSGLLGFSTLFIIWYPKNTKEHNVSETGPISILRGGVGDTCPVGSLRKS
jgi:hypothetical protein